jgi:hypothetical protein
MSKARVTVLLFSVLVLVLAAMPAHAQGGTAVARLRPFDEVPALSTGGGGRFSATISADGSEITYQLSYSNLNGVITQSHLHLAQKGVNGGIMIFLCSNLGNGPAGTQTCPTGNGTISGTITASNVIGGAAAQGLTPGDLNAVLRALRVGVVYVNVHTSTFPGGEIRGQLQFTPTP